MAALFSERYGYVKPREALIKECMPKEVENALCTLFDKWNKDYDALIQIKPVEQTIWCYFLNNRLDDLYRASGSQKAVVVPFLQSDDVEWYKKLDLIEFLLQFVIRVGENINDGRYAKAQQEISYLQGYINTEFKRLHYGYRVIKGNVVPITSDQELETIEEAIGKNEDPVQKHLNQALQHFANRETPDYRNSIKESISAVEVYCRDLTGEGTLGRALDVLEKKGVHIHKESISAVEVYCRDLTGEGTLGRALDVLEKKGVHIHPILKGGMHKMYDYTNQPEVGARHGLMDDTTDYSPSYNEAYYMLVACSAFINYLRGVVAK